MAKTKRIDKAIGLRLKKARMEQKLTYDELAEKSGVSTRYIFLLNAILQVCPPSSKVQYTPLI